MRYIDNLKLIEVCIKAGMLKTMDGYVLVCRKTQQGDAWFKVSKEDLAQELIEDTDGANFLIKELKKRNIEFLLN